MNVCIFCQWIEKDVFFLDDLVHNSNRHSLYEPPTQITPRLKRTETFSSRKISPTIERQFARESKVILLEFFLFCQFSPVILPAQNVQITNVRSVQFKVTKKTISHRDIFSLSLVGETVIQSSFTWSISQLTLTS